MYYYSIETSNNYLLNLSFENSEKMSSAHLLDINVDQLFERHSIAEIDQIHKQLQNNIEEKKEDLRIMVG